MVCRARTSAGAPLSKNRDRAVLPPQSRQDAHDFAGVTASVEAEAPVLPTFHSPADLVARLAERGCGLVLVPAGAVKVCFCVETLPRGATQMLAMCTSGCLLTVRAVSWDVKVR